MAIVQIQSAPAAQTHGPSGVGAKGSNGDTASTGFEALFALEIETQDGMAASQTAPKAQLEDDSAASEKDAQADAVAAEVTTSAETILPPGLVLPALAQAAGTAPAGAHANVSSAQDRAATPARRPPATGQVGIANTVDEDASARRLPARTAQPELMQASAQIPGKALADTISAERPGDLSATGIDKSNAQTLLQTQHPQAAARLPAATPAAAALELPMTMDAPEWGDALAQRVILLAGRNEQRAEIRINPQHLGPIEVSLSFGGEDNRQAAVHFSAAQAPVREALESSLPRLREMFEQAGIQLGDATVGTGTSERDHGHAGQRPRGAGSPAVSAGSVAAVGPQRVSEGMVDTFA